MKKNSKENIDTFMWKDIYRNKWFLPFAVITVFIGILSLRLLSDPDLGFHLNAGRWIIDNFSFPHKDTFTFTVTQNDYIDLHWLFQVIIFLFYKMISYEGLSILVACLSLVLLYFLLKRNHNFGIPLYLSCILFLAGFLLIELRVLLRPEMFTFIFITVILLVLDNYYHRKTKQLYLLVVLMLLWCNMHSLFILGFALSGSYFISIWIRDKKIDVHFLLWMCLSFAVCIITPYFIKGYTFPLELFTRLDSNNIYHQYIKEFKSFFHIDVFTVKDVLFIIFMAFSFVITLITISRRKVHELILLIIFLYLALISIRNIPLFVIVALPIAGSSMMDFIETIRKKSIFKKLKWIRTIVFYFLLIAPVLLSFRLFTNSWYYSNESYFKTGVGIDNFQQPEKASEFIINNKLKGNILNSIGFGGWLEWRTNQPVFIDGRLEVMKEGLYNEVVKSWNDGLPELINKYNPKYIVYNYQKYYTWTNQIVVLPSWKLIYLDGLTAVFAMKDSTDIPEVDLTALPAKYNLPDITKDEEKEQILKLSGSIFISWMEGFYKKVDYDNRSLINIASFCLQLKQYTTAERIFLEALKKSKGQKTSVYYALSEIYQAKGDKEKADICNKKISSFDKKTKIVFSSIKDLNYKATDSAKEVKTNSNENEAKLFFNSGNNKYRNGDVEGALKDYDTAISRKPDYYKAYNNRAIIKSNELKKDKEAIEDFDKAIRLKTDYADAYLGRGTSKYNLKDYEGACNDWRKAVALGNVQASVQIEKFCK
jgi:tetratricopeptide (TPR) repeat protein